jgi:hypothetical protein
MKEFSDLSTSGHESLLPRPDVILGRDDGSRQRARARTGVTQQGMIAHDTLFRESVHLICYLLMVGTNSEVMQDSWY